MIAEAAYLRAERRGFVGGNPMEDWLAAEMEVNALWSGEADEKGTARTGRRRPMAGGAEAQREDLAAYERLREEIRRLLAEARDTVSMETIRHTVDTATRELKEAGDYTSERINRAADAMKKDIASAAERMGPKWEAFTDRTADLFDVWQDRGSEFLASASKAVSDWLRHAGKRKGKQTYQAGELTPGGTFECTACGERLELSGPAHLVPCPKCQKKKFRQV